MKVSFDPVFLQLLCIHYWRGPTNICFFLSFLLKGVIILELFKFKRVIKGVSSGVPTKQTPKFLFL